MKSHSIFAVIVIFLIAIACSTVKTPKETIQKIQSIVESRDYSIRWNFANPLRMVQIPLTSDYTLRVKADSAFAYLPYYGVAHIAPFYPNESGIKFSTVMEDYRITKNKKGDGWDVKFVAKTIESKYNVILNLFDNGSATLQVSNSQKDPITFYGEMIFP